MKKCLLHIGTTKTGTSSIQAMLDENRDILESNSYYMIPNKIRFGNSDFKFLVSQSRDWNLKFDDVTLSILKIKSKSDKYLFDLDTEQELQDYINQHQDQNLILTSEQFYSRIISEPYVIYRTLRFLRKLGFETTIIIYVRSQFGWILSDYIQNIKDGGVKSIDLYLNDLYKENPLAYDINHLIKLLNKFPEELIIRPYDFDLLYKSDSCLDFLKHGLKLSEPTIGEFKRINTNLSNKIRPTKTAIEKIIEFNQVYRINEFSKKHLNNVIINSISLNFSDDEPLSLSESSKMQIRKYYLKGNHELSNKYTSLNNLLL